MNPNRHLTILLLIALSVAVFGLEQSGGESLAEGYGAVPALVGPAWDQLIHGELSLSVVRELSRLVTAIFVHGDLEHLLLNMVFLWAFGYLASEILGQWWVLAVFFITGVCGNVVQVWLNAGSPVVIIGASGAVCGFEGLYLGLALRWQLPDPAVWPLARPVSPLRLALFAIVGFLGDVYFLANRAEGIAFGAHIGGFLAGLAIAAILTTVYPTSEIYKRKSRL